MKPATMTESALTAIHNFFCLFLFCFVFCFFFGFPWIAVYIWIKNVILRMFLLAAEDRNVSLLNVSIYYKRSKEKYRFLF